MTCQVVRHISSFLKKGIKGSASLTQTIITHPLIMKLTLIFSTIIVVVNLVFGANVKPKRGALFREHLSKIAKSPSTINNEKSDYKTKEFYQYSTVKKPENFKWGFNRGNPSHFHGQFLERIGSTFKSAVSYKITKFNFIFELLNFISVSLERCVSWTRTNALFLQSLTNCLIFTLLLQLQRSRKLDCIAYQCVLHYLNQSHNNNLVFLKHKECKNWWYSLQILGNLNFPAHFLTFC